MFRSLLIEGAFLAGLIGASTPALQDLTPVVVRIEEDSLVVRYNPAGHARHAIYVSEGYVRALSVSPSGAYVSFIETVRRPGASERRFVVIQPSGRVVRAIPYRDMQRYTWCCGAGKVAVIAGPDYEGGIGFLPSEAWITNVESGAEERLTGIRQPFQFHWAAFDSSLYVRSFYPESAGGPAVYRYHPPSGQLSPTSHKGLVFSPDGKYYFDPSIEGSEFRLYRTADDSDVTDGLQLPDEAVRWGPEAGWMPGGNHLLVFLDRKQPPPARPGEERRGLVRVEPQAPQVYPDRWNIAVDAETGGVVLRFQGDIGAGWKTNAEALPVERHGGVLELFAGGRLR